MAQKVASACLNPNIQSSYALLVLKKFTKMLANVLRCIHPYAASKRCAANSRASGASQQHSDGFET